MSLWDSSIGTVSLMVSSALVSNDWAEAVLVSTGGGQTALTKTLRVGKHTGKGFRRYAALGKVRGFCRDHTLVNGCACRRVPDHRLYASVWGARRVPASAASQTPLFRPATSRGAGGCVLSTKSLPVLTSGCGCNATSLCSH